MLFWLKNRKKRKEKKEKIRSKNRALILIGFAGGFRRSELVAIHYEDIDPVYSSASAITQQDPSRYRVAGFNKGGILSTRSAKQMVA